MIEKIFPASIEVLSDVLAFVEEELEDFACSMKDSMQICLCMEEMFVNVAHYAYEDSDGKVVIQLDKEDNGMLSITLIDEGKPFDPLGKEDPDVTLSVEERQIGGLGIFMVKKSMDEVYYERKEEKNIFTMKKEIGK